MTPTKLQASSALRLSPGRSPGNRLEDCHARQSLRRSLVLGCLLLLVFVLLTLLASVYLAEEISRAPNLFAWPSTAAAGGDPLLNGCNPQLLNFVFATTTNSQRHMLIKASRGHRQARGFGIGPCVGAWGPGLEQPLHRNASVGIKGMRMVVITNITGADLAVEAAEGAAYCEDWRYFPDQVVVVEGFPRPLVGELRLGIAPFLVHDWLGDDTFKWIMYGDDDTLWFLEGVKFLVKGFDPELPWFLTDNYYSSDSPGFGPRKPKVPRCLPCNMDVSGLDLPALRAVQSCTCTPAVVCGAQWNTSKEYPCDPEHPPLEGNHGGAGSLLSIGLLQRAPLAAVRQCLEDHPKWLGDHAFYHCLWRAGYAHTDPGHAARHQGTLLFDALDGKPRQMARLADRSMEALRGAGASRSASRGNAGALDEAAILRSMVSMHLSAGRYCSSAAAAQVMGLVYSLYEAWWGAVKGMPGAAQRVSKEAADISELLHGRKRREAKCLGSSV